MEHNYESFAVHAIKGTVVNLSYIDWKMKVSVNDEVSWCVRHGMHIYLNTLLVTEIFMMTIFKVILPLRYKPCGYLVDKAK